MYVMHTEGHNMGTCVCSYTHTTYIGRSPDAQMWTCTHTQGAQTTQDIHTLQECYTLTTETTYVYEKCTDMFIHTVMDML